jgi:hypothetical protein
MAGLFDTLKTIKGAIDGVSGAASAAGAAANKTDEAASAANAAAGKASDAGVGDVTQGTRSTTSTASGMVSDSVKFTAIKAHGKPVAISAGDAGADKDKVELAAAIESLAGAKADGNKAVNTPEELTALRDALKEKGLLTKLTDNQHIKFDEKDGKVTGMNLDETARLEILNAAKEFSMFSEPAKSMSLKASRVSDDHNLKGVVGLVAADVSEVGMPSSAASAASAAPSKER